MGRWWIVLLLVWACRSDPPAQTIEEPSQGEQEARIVRESFRRVLADFHGDVIAGRIESAYARLAPMLRERLPLDRFTAMRTHPFFSDGVDFTVRGTTEATST